VKDGALRDQVLSAIDRDALVELAVTLGGFDSPWG
jgi:hypothetical protein